MTLASPSEFLTFYRRLAVSRKFIPLARSRANPCQRLFSSTIVSRNDTGSGHVLSNKGTQQDTGPGNATGPSREHATVKAAKNDTTNIQSDASARGMSARSSDAGGHATRERDESNSAAKAKREHPEAPDTVVGMQDERGGKGI